MRIIEARGPVVAALKRYDPGLRVRWSHERKQWAVDAPFAENTDPRFIPKPVRFEKIEDGEGEHWVARLMPEYSERSMQFRDKRYVVCWAKNLTREILGAVRRCDSHRPGMGNLVKLFDHEIVMAEESKKKSRIAATDERVYTAWDKFKFHLRKNPNAEDGSGVSIKGKNWGRNA